MLAGYVQGKATAAAASGAAKLVKYAKKTHQKKKSNQKPKGAKQAKRNGSMRQKGLR
jgi:hypothetical protein